ncbi:recombinase family protein [Amycolatopsis japonica]|uniref:recombinase family protein n=1 Tax=Amycolatopsis japonica TaxID=208439 RepID=UPI0037BA19BA
MSVLGDDATSPESQAINGEDKARALGATEIYFAEDLDVSAFKVSPWNRPDLGAWLRRPDDFDMLIVRAIDRLCRNLGDLIKIIDWAKEHNIRIVFLEQDLDLTSPYGLFTAHILGAVAQLQPGITQSLVKESREFMLSVARWPAGRPLFGYRKCPHPSGKGYALEWDDAPFFKGRTESPASVVQEMATRVQSEPRSSIATDFNRRGIPSPTAYMKMQRGEDVPETAVWYPSTIHDILIGQDGHGYAIRALVTRVTEWATLEGKKNPMAKGRKVPVKWAVELDDEGIPLRYCPEPLLTDTEWSVVKKAIEARRMTDVKERTDNAALVGILKCAECGHTMYRTARARKDKSVRAHYQCMSKRLKNTGCVGSTAEENEAIELVRSTWMQEMQDKPVMVLRETTAQNYQAQIEEEEERLERLMSELESGEYDDAPALKKQFRQRVVAISDRIEKLKALPTVEAESSLHPMGYTYRELYEEIYGEDVPSADLNLSPLRARGVKFYVSGKHADGPLSTRITWDASEWDTVLKPARAHKVDSWDEIREMTGLTKDPEHDELSDEP